MKKFQKRPGTLILWELVSIFVNFSTNLYISALILSETEDKSDYVNIIIFFEYYTVVGIVYLFFLSLEIFIKVRYPLNVSHKNRYICYHVLG